MRIKHTYVFINEYINTSWYISTNKHFINPLSANLTIWSNALKLFVGTFWQLKALYKWWKMLFISRSKLISFSRYLSFCRNFLVMQQKGLIRKIRLISNFMTSQPGQQTIVIHVLHNISRSKGNQTMKFRQLIQCNMRNIFLEISDTKCGRN